jgi:sugar/nucleoside kinase (ribokinase family)
VDYRYDVYGIGNAIVDTEVLVEDLVLGTHGLKKGVMTLVSEDVQGALLDGLADYAQHGAAGGSAANTVVGVAQFGGKPFFTGKVGGDMRGALYRKSMAEVGVEFDVAATNGAPTGSCLVLVTPDGERTMQTSLGASAGLVADDVDVERIGQSQLIYVEGYLFGSPTAGAAAVHSMEAAKSAGVKISLTLSDPGMAEHFIDDFRRVTKEYVDILFCNEHEARIYADGGNRQEIIKAVGQDCGQVFMTCGGDGSMVYDHGAIMEVPGYSVPVVDTTGAGDVYAAGVLYGLTSGKTVTDAGRLGSFASARIVTQMGPRLQVRLGDRIAAILADAMPTDEF